MKKIILLSIVFSVFFVSFREVQATSFVAECFDATYRDEQSDLIIMAQREDEADINVIEEEGNIYTLVPLVVESVEKGDEDLGSIIIKQLGGTLLNGKEQKFPSLTLDWASSTVWRLNLIENKDETHTLVCGEYGRIGEHDSDKTRQVLPGFKSQLINSGLSNDLSGAGIMKFMTLVVILVIWSVVWKGIALWYAARSEQKVWFIILVMTNTLGILEIIYLLFGRHKSDKPKSRDVSNDDHRVN